ncbi:helix-turn-helix transcriptional regulator [Nocardia fusca]|uniref:helix-turn-helix transcriptional regulator n=1 Tax=Nocardia fusca TaxID=941183 RepID=UPI0009FF5C25|nr:helix-turn-helix transcriptional regulator [Nocardia fusca]
MTARSVAPAVGRAALADELAREIKRLRTEAGMSQRVLAGRIGYSRQYVSMAEWEDANLPSRELISALDGALGANGGLIRLRDQAQDLHRAGQWQVASAPSHPVHPAARLPLETRSDLVGELLPVLATPGRSDSGIEAIHSPHAVAETYAQQSDVAGEVRALAKQAGNIDVLAVRGLGIIGLNDSLLRKVIPSGTRLRVMLLHPDSMAVAHRAAQIGESPESFAAGIRLAIKRISELSSEDRFVQVYTYDQSQCGESSGSTTSCSSPRSRLTTKGTTLRYIDSNPRVPASCTRRSCRRWNRRSPPENG